MQTAHICKCNNCDRYLYDENPQIDAVERNIEDFVKQSIKDLNDYSEFTHGK